MKKLLVYLVALLLFVDVSGAKKPHDIYKSKGTWEKTIVNLKSDIINKLDVNGLPFISDVMTVSQKAKAIEINVENLKELVLVTWGTEDGNTWDHSVWANSKLIKKNGDEVYIDQLKFQSAISGMGKPRINKNSKNKVIKIKNRKYEHGVFAAANSEIVIGLNNEYKSFVAEIGVDDVARKNSSVIFRVQNLSINEIGKLLSKDFPEETNLILHFSKKGIDNWLTTRDGSVERLAIKNLLKELAHPGYFQDLLLKADKLPSDKKEEAYLNIFKRATKAYSINKKLALVNPESILLSVADMKNNSAYNYSKYVAMANELSVLYNPTLKGVNEEDKLAFENAEKILKNKREVLLSNPVLDFDKIIAVRHNLKGRARSAMGPEIGTQKNNWSVHASQKTKGFNNEIIEISNLRGEVKTKTIFKPTDSSPLSSLVMHWDADRLLFTSIGSNNRWNVFEINTDGTGIKEIVKLPETDIDYFDGCYLPSGKFLVNSTIGYNGVPCVNGGDKVGNLGLYDAETKNYRRLNFGQDNDWSPTVMNNGRIMYLRWEYTDNTHYFSRIMMHMNPDGSNKKELYGSGSYWPNTMFDAKPLPGKTNTQFSAIVSGHHGIARSGRLVIFDPKKGRQEDAGVIQEIPYRNRKVVPEIKDRLVDGVWPQFLKPTPLNDNYYLVTAKLDHESLWGLYLVDVFDNMTPLAMFEGKAITEAIPVIKKIVPPVIPERVNTSKLESTVYIQDIYEGKGTEGVPEGTIKELRILAYEFAYIKSPSNHNAQGVQSGWDIKRLLGTVPVEKDGSVIFKIPANLPISIQPLDAQGRAVQLMRSWMTGMPGEVVSCVGCHEDQSTVAKPTYTIASRKKPSDITPPNGGVRPFTFELEMQPILDKNCVACHDGDKNSINFKDDSKSSGVLRFGKSYLALHPYVNRQGPEADIHTMKPMEYHASTSELIQMLEKGHQNVKLEDEELRTIYNWIDFNAPYNSTFQAKILDGYDQVNRRQELMQKYNNISIDWKKEIRDYAAKLEAEGEIKSVEPDAEKRVKHKKLKQKGWPFNSKEAINKQKEGSEISKVLEIGSGVDMKLVKVPAGKFIMGSETGDSDEYPRAKVEIGKGFWMGEIEVTNEQFNVFFPEHNSRFTAQFWKDHVNEGYPSNLPKQPVIRVSWKEAMEFCEKLSVQTGLKVTLPTEAQWEWAARAGSDEDLWWGGVKSDFGKYANLADVTLKDMAVIGVNPKPMPKHNPNRPYYDFIPRSKTVDDGVMIAQEGKKFSANPWGLYDIIGNVQEWTISDYTSYPYSIEDNRNSEDITKKKVTRGGSWRDRAEKATSSYRTSYESWQKVYNVGFRIIIEE